MEATTAAEASPAAEAASAMSDSTDINNNMEEDAKQLPSPEEQASAIEAAEAEGFAAGDQMHIISARWWGDWCAYSRYKQPAAPADDTSSAAAGDDTAPPPPGPIDNSDILESFKGDLRPNLEEDKELVILTGQSWALLHDWYGGDQAIPRPAMLEGLAQKKARVMLYPLKLDVCWSGKPLEIKTMMAEKSESVRSLKERACAEFGVDPAATEIWDYFHNSKYSALEPHLEKNLDEARILDEQAILLDDKEDPLPVDTKSSSGPTVLALGTGGRSFGRNASMVAEDMTMQRSDGRPGLVGLQNLGNTCFMNSSLQCLMHSVPIMRVFLSGLYEGNLNTSNPLGMKGQLATAFGSLMGNIWRPDVGAVVPKGFKAKIAQFAPQFSGYQQHDSQEFLAFLLDGLHEDINRIQVKPYIEEPDSEGRSDNELAAEAWANYRRRNDSHIVDHFQGLYKSTLVCPQCQYSSVKFDPFMYLSLPLPESKVRQLTLVLLHADGSRLPREYGLEVPQSGTVRDVYVALARAAGLELAAPEQHMVGAKLEARFSSYSLTPFEDARGRVSEVCRDLSDTTLLVYFYPDPATGPAGPGNKKVVVYHRKRGTKASGDGKFSAPLLLWLPEEAMYDPALHVTPAPPPPPPPAIGSSSIGSNRGFDFCSSGSSSSRESEFCVAGDAPIWGAIHTMLQPFLAPATLQQPFLQEQPQDQDQDQQADYPAGGEEDAAAGVEQQQRQQARPREAVDTSMAAAPGLPNSPAASPSRQEGLAQQQQLQQQSPGAAGGEDNSTWGSHGSDSPRSAMELGDLAEPAEQQQLPGEAAAAGAAAAAAPGASPVGGGSDAGEPDAAAAFAMQELNSGLEPGAAEAAAGGGGGDGGVLIGAGGVPVAPLDMWGDAAMQDTPVDAGLAAAAAAAAGVVPYTLKLARDTGETKAGWYASHFHPKAFHYTFVLDWDMAAAVQMSLGDYLTAAEAAAEPAAAAGEEPGAAAAAGDDAHRLHPAAPCCQEQQQEQHGGGGGAPRCAQQQQGEAQEQAWAPVHCWTPSLTPGTVMGDGQPATYEAVAAEPVVVCGGYVVSALTQPEYDVSVAAVRRAREEARGGRSVELVACVEAFLQPEQLSEADEWYCPKCKEHVQADKKLDLWSLPEVLVVHLKRFSYTRWNRDKLDTQVLFPLQGLDLGDYVLHAQEQPPLYDCFAVSNHYGGLGGGHYTAFAQMPDDRKWFCFDDSRVDEMTPEAVQSRAAYVLFYRRRQQAAADPANQVELLLQQRQQHLQQKQQAAEAAAAEAAAAEAAAAGGSTAAASAMDEDAPLVLGAAPIALPAAATGDNNLQSPADGSSGDIWGSPSPGQPAAAGDAAAGPAAGSPVAMLPQFTTASRLAAGRRGAGTDTTTTTTTSSTAEDGDSSDGSSSRPRGAGAAAAGRRLQPRQQQQQQQQVDELAGADELAALNCGRRASDQELPADHDMADRDA